MMTYRNAPNYTRTINRPDGTVIETYIHCGKCQCVIVGIHCTYCSQKSQRKAARLAALRHLSKP